MTAEYKKFRNACRRDKGDRTEKSERQRARKDINKPNDPTFNTSQLIWDIEISMAASCYQDELNADILGYEHRCTCNDPSNWTYEQCINWFEGEMSE